MNTSDEQRVRELAIAQNNDAKEELKMGKLALSMLQGIDKNSKILPERAIWEMIQNAHDVSIPEGADIVFQATDDCFYFKHNGIPFTCETLNALNTQSSSKAQTNIRQIGQYGTGFMTTHKFGLVFEVSGAIQIEPNRYINFNSFQLDRSKRDKKELINAINEQEHKINEFVSNSPLSSECNKITEFKYIHKYPVEKENVEIALSSAPSLVPYVLSLIDRVNSISFIDKGGNKLSFQKSTEEILEKKDQYTYKSVQIIKNHGAESLLKIFILESKDSIEIEGESIPKVSVILPLKEEGDKLEIFQFNERIPNHFIYLPLIGTEKWGLNYIFHSPIFACDNELRDSIRFVSSGQYGDADSDRNKSIINLASNIIDMFWRNHLPEFKNVKYIAKVGFKTNDSDVNLANYYKDLQTEWTKRYKNYNIATVKEKSSDKLVDPGSLWLLNSDMLEEAKSNKDFLSAIYYFMVQTKSEATVPIEEDLIYWSETMLEWWPDSPQNFFVTPDTIAKTIQEKKLCSADNILYLLEFNKFVKSKCPDLFDKYELIPTESLVLKKKELLKKPEEFNATLREVLDILIPKKTSLFVHNSFAFILDETSRYSNCDANQHIKEYADTIKEKQFKSRDELKGYISDGAIFRDAGEANITLQMKDRCDVTITNESIEDAHIKAMIDYCSMIIKTKDSTNARLLQLVKSSIGYDKCVDETLNEDYKCSHVLKTIVYDWLYKFTIQEQDDKSKQKEFILKFVSELFNHSDWRDCLHNYMIYPNQYGVYRYAKEVKKEVDIPEKLKNWYDKILCTETLETLPIRSILLDTTYSSIFVADSECKGEELADKLYNQIENDTKWKINDYIHSGIVIELLEYINKDEKPWPNLFSRLDENKRAQIMLSTVDDPNKSTSIFKFIKFNDQEKMSKLAALGEDKDMDLIISMGKQLIEQKREEQKEKEYKNKLGKYVEKFLREQLLTKLQHEHLLVSIGDVQGGQDIVISINDRVVYRIEVKSIWRNTTSDIKMTMCQLNTSVAFQEKYALCVVNMENISHSIIETNDPIEDLGDRIWFSTEIGRLNQGLACCVNDMNSCPTKLENLNGQKVIVPLDKVVQRLSLDQFCKFILNEMI